MKKLIRGLILGLSLFALTGCELFSTETTKTITLEEFVNIGNEMLSTHKTENRLVELTQLVVNYSTGSADSSTVTLTGVSNDGKGYETLACTEPDKQSQYDYLADSYLEICMPMIAKMYAQEKMSEKAKASSYYKVGKGYQMFYTSESESVSYAWDEYGLPTSAKMTKKENESSSTITLTFTATF